VSTDSRQLATGGAVLGGAMIVANGGNYLLNIFLGRWLTPPEFADANLMVTIMLLVTAIAISLQLIAARFTGVHTVAGDEAAVAATARWLERRAAIAGAVVAVVLAGASPFLRDVFNSASAWPFVILGAGMPFYLVQAVGRGVLQGRLQFAPLAATFVVEMVVRVSLGIGLVALGLGVIGATIALTVSFLAVWLHVRLLEHPADGSPLSAGSVSSIIAYASPVAVLLLGQIIINNGDVLIAKGFLDPETAGVYAAIALVGRAVFFLSWSVATTLFPAAAQRGERGEDSDNLLYAGCGIVAVMGAGFVVGAWWLGGTVLGKVLGPEYGEVSSPLAWYAAATSMFAIANLIVSHHLSLDQRRESFVLIGGAVVQTILLFIGRGDIDSLIRAQVIAMAILLIAVVTSHIISRKGGRFALPATKASIGTALAYEDAAS
jgi:O-antigen/teichoic acid export membrane protein